MCVKCESEVSGCSQSLIALHASYFIHHMDDVSLFVWAEEVADIRGKQVDGGERNKATASVTPMRTLARDALTELCGQLFGYLRGNTPGWSRQTLYVPHALAAGGTARLVPVQVDTLWLNKSFLFKIVDRLLTGDLPEGVIIADSARFWSQVVHWVTELVAREQVVPALATELRDGRRHSTASWRPLITEAVAHDLDVFKRAMPLSCCASVWVPRGLGDEDSKRFVDEALAITLDHFVNEHVDSLVRETLLDESPIAWEQGSSIVKKFTHALFEPRQRLEDIMSASSVKKLETVLEERASAASALFDEPTPPTQLVLRLAPVSEDDGGGTSAQMWQTVDQWELQYWVRTDVASGIAEAATGAAGAETGTRTGETGADAPDRAPAPDDGPAAEHGRVPDKAPDLSSVAARPLASLWESDRPVDSAVRVHCVRRLLGIARQFPFVFPSPDRLPPRSAPLQWGDVHWLLSDGGRAALAEAGAVVEIPQWMNATPAKLRVTVTAKPRGDGRFTLHSLVDFEWKATIDGIDLDEATFQTLVDGQLPLLQRGDRWVALDSDVVAALQRVSGVKANRRDETIRGVVSVVEELEGVLDTDVVLGDSLDGAERDSPDGAHSDLPDGGISAPKADIAHSSFRRMWELFRGEFTFTDIEVPDSLHAGLRPYQQRGLSWLTLMRELGLGTCLADDMGLGKTIQVIAYLLHQKERGEAGDPSGPRDPSDQSYPSGPNDPSGPSVSSIPSLAGDPNDPSCPSLVICPTSVVDNWRREIERFAPALTVHIHHGPERLRGGDMLDMLHTERPDVVITSYGIAMRDFETLHNVSWTAVIADEAQHIKNPSAQQTRAVKRLRAQHRIALTGTPIENRLEELWSIMDFLNPGFLGSAEQFQTTFVGPIEGYGDERAARRLRRLVRPFILRRMKEDATLALDLPQKQEEKVYCTLTPEQAALYQATVDEMMAKIASATGMHRRGFVLAALTRLKQICNHPALLLKEDWAAPQRSGKLQTLIDRLRDALDSGEKALVFTQYAAMGGLLQSILAETFAVNVPFLHGGVPRPQRDRLIEQFQKDDDSRLFVLSLRAGGVGISLTRATHVFHYDRWWNPAVESQATDRAYRIGQTESVNVHTFVCRGTVEEHIDATIEEKRKLAGDIIESGETWITELETDELLNIFSLRETAVRQ